jgi:hypothetical protein
MNIKANEIYAKSQKFHLENMTFIFAYSASDTSDRIWKDFILLLNFTTELCLWIILRKEKITNFMFSYRLKAVKLMKLKVIYFLDWRSATSTGKFCDNMHHLF